MKSVLISLLFFNYCIPLFAQSLQKNIAKPAINTSVFDRWPSAGMPTISNDGNYALYSIGNQPADGSTLVIRSLKNSWRKEIVNASNASFADDCKKVFFISSGRLCGLNLSSGSSDSLARTSSYKLIKQNGEEWLIYELNNTVKELKAVNLKSNEEKSFSTVINYLFSANGSVLVLLKQSKEDNKSQTIDWVDFPSGDARSIWSGSGASNFMLNEDANQLAFIVETKDASSKDDEPQKSIFYYKTGNEKAELLADNHTKGIDSDLCIERIGDGFSKDGEKLFIFLKEKDRPKPKPGAVMVDVWSYLDNQMQSSQLNELAYNQMYGKWYEAVIPIRDHKIVRLKQEGDRSISSQKPWSDNVLATYYSGGDRSEIHWNAKRENLNYLVDTKDGERHKLPLESESISPSGKYIIGRVTDDRPNFYCYNTSTGKTLNITKSISALFDEKLDDKAPPGFSKWLGIGGWLNSEKGVILFDRYDMWMVDPEGIQPPINLTNGYGQKNKIVFQLPGIYENNFISTSRRIILKAFNRLNKEQGFYYIEMGKLKNGPQVMTMGPYNYEIPNTAYNSAQLNSSGSQRFLVRRESTNQSPNYFLTSDFKTFTPVTDVYPETSYNWLKSELYTWKSLNGETLQGILYKPENFDPKKKYPVIFHYYQRKSDDLNKYLEPEAITDHLNIPWFVSNDYLVFTPDIHYEMGKVGESALSSLVSAAHYLQRFPWVDVKRMGIQGQSFGGYETNYIITHSNLFAAAMSSSGYTDLISIYNSLGWGGMSAQGYFDQPGQQGNMGATLWENPGIYIKQTTIFQAPSVSTPVLFMANRKDELNFPQQLELFLALRRLGKRAWLLQYDNGDHTLDLPEDALQHTIRMTQFFDHYLKDSACPRWMLYGIPAKMKGLDDGLELVKEKDPKIGKWLTPKEAVLLKDEEKKKIEALKKLPTKR